MTSRGRLLFLAGFLFPTAVIRPQEFEVAVVKPHAPGTACGESNTYAGGRLILNCFTLYEIVREALDLQPGRSGELTGGPDWVNQELWDISAKAANVAGELSPAAWRTMLLKLAKEEFQLKLRSQKKELKGFELVMDRKRGPRARLVPNSGAPWRLDLKPGISLTAQRVSMKEFAGWLKMPMAVGQHVEDKTGLQGQYDFLLKWRPNDIQRADNPPSVNDAPTIFTALNEQLGLRLKPARVVTDVYIIETVQQPRE